MVDVTRGAVQQNINALTKRMEALEAEAKAMKITQAHLLAALSTIQQILGMDATKPA